MQLSRFTDFSLRVLLYLAINRQKRATLQEIADFYPLSLEHLRKVVHALARAGYLLTYRGKNGGMELARPPKDILIGEVVRQFEGQENLVDCEGLDCRLASVCSLKKALKQGQNALYSSLNEYSLADLVEEKPTMVRLLVNDVA
ncbi:MAG: Rrf2 family transcriptional regulator [Gammaproteobacteria bacterium]|nr:Rrf2 family transcriptional regulator [Gammaproteobacteria bacterium]|tara:strand:- start:2545 stop:2976 length:432 start_codon:yes stop_codon:yes gene_type:complete